MGKKKKTTMSVPEMRRMLGLKKTDSYWLVHKQCFETILVEGRMRIVIESFEHWYANQVKHKKVNGPPPGEELRSYSYSPQELAEELGVTDSVIYDLVKTRKLETFKVDTWMRIRKDVFEEWYQTQSRYRTKADRERDAELENSTLSMPEMARLLGIPREQVYGILRGNDRREFQYVMLGDRRRITRESFERWYAGQNKYRKLCDRPAEEIAEMEKEKAVTLKPRLAVDENKSAFSLQEAAVLLDLTYNEVRSLIRYGDLAAKKVGSKYLIPRDEITWYIHQQQLEREEMKGVSEDGIDRTEK